MNLAEAKPLWTPSPARIALSNLTAFRLAAEQRWGLSLPDYEALYAWSVTRPEQFWVSVWEGAGTGGPVIGYLPEYDALPGLDNAAEPRPTPGPGATTPARAGHGCGHNMLGRAARARPSR